MQLTLTNRSWLVWAFPLVLFLAVSVLQLLKQPSVNPRAAYFYDAPPLHRNGATTTNALNKDFFSEIPEPQINAALQLLGEKRIVAISPDQVLALLASDIKIDDVMEDLSSRVLRAAEQTEIDAAKPVRRQDYEGRSDGVYQSELKHKEFLKRYAIERREYASYVAGLRGKLKPYLIKLTAQNRTIGQYRGWIESGTLHVLNGLYQKTAVFRPYPVIVFLSIAPEHLEEETYPIPP